jgi:Flp pilus assembly protein CpaB
VFSRTTDVVGAVVLAPLVPGELIQSSSVVRSLTPSDQRQISVPIETARALGDRLVAGELVDVVATFGTGSDAYTVTVVTGARVVSRDATGGTLGDRKTEIVTLSVSDARSAVAIAHAVAAGEISFIRVTSARAEPNALDDVYRTTRPSAAK